MTSLGRYFPDSQDAQIPADVAVVIPTLMRPSLTTAIDCVYAQVFNGRIQLMIGADLNPTATDEVDAALARRPEHVSAVVLTLPYSTSVRHGGLHPAWDGGALRATLSFMANARRVAYLDDDNVWTPGHLASLRAAMADKAWAYSLRMLIDEETGEELGVDRWDAVGPGKGRFKAQGGMVDPNCLMLDKVALAEVLWLWSDPGPDYLPLEADRRVAAALSRFPGGETGKATVLYRIRRTNILRKFLREGQEF